MIQQKTLYIFLAKRTVWFWFAGKRSCLKPVSKPLNSENILEHCRKWSSSRIILFLEFPWVLTHFDITITLSSEELASFAKMRLSLANKADTGERSVRAKQSRNPVSAENHVGGIYYKQAQPDRVGLLCATLSKECVRLKKMLSLVSGVSVEVVPLVVACLPLLLKNPKIN